MNLILTIKTENDAKLYLKQGGNAIDNESLTISQDFDTLLIRSIDKLLVRNRIDRLSLETLEIQGKLRPGAISSMILKTISSALEL